MTCLTCENDPCTCNASHERLPKPDVRSTYKPVPLGITKEEFGVNLYETIKIIGGMQGLQDQIAGAIHRGAGDKVQGLTDRRNALRKDLAGAMTTLTPSETMQILDTYPLVKHL